MNEYLEVVVSCATSSEAEVIANILVEQRLAACVQTWPIRSVYRWKEEFVHGDEHLLLAKTSVGRESEVVEVIHRLHSYELPPITLHRVEALDSAYFNWILENSGPVLSDTQM